MAATVSCVWKDSVGIVNVLGFGWVSSLNSSSQSLLELAIDLQIARSVRVDGLCFLRTNLHKNTAVVSNKL